jgi:hypothetical protein
MQRKKKRLANKIDPNFRPDDYFRPIGLQRYLISQVKGATVRTRVERLLGKTRLEELDALLGDTGVPDDIVKGLKSAHPSFMGGNYLPDLEEGEVEVARIEIASTTADVRHSRTTKTARDIYVNFPIEFLI